MFKSASIGVRQEAWSRKDIQSRMLKFGLTFLDDATGGILPTDLIVAGAYSGAGKTQLCTNIALTNIDEGKRVHFFALEAEHFEIERRMLYQYITRMFFLDADRPRLSRPLNYYDWFMGRFDKELDKYDKVARDFLEKTLTNLHTYYKEDSFTVDELIKRVTEIENDTDLIIIDHVHYFDWTDPDNKAIKEIAKTARSLALEAEKPIILISHLRKKDKWNSDLAPDLDEFHGSSDLYKVATKVITLAKDAMLSPTRYSTFIRVAKNRIDGGVTRYIGQAVFNSQKGIYEEDYRVGWANAEEFADVDASLRPYWARGCRDSLSSGDLLPRKPADYETIKRARIVPYVPGEDQGDDV